MEFYIRQAGSGAPRKRKNRAYLHIDNWNDFGFVTSFVFSLHDEIGEYHEIGTIKIGFKGQEDDSKTHSTIPDMFEALPEGYFSLGMDVNYYSKLANLPIELRDNLLASLRDVAFDESYLTPALDEKVFGTSLLRNNSLSVIRGQYRRVLEGGVALTDYKFLFRRLAEDDFAGIELVFEVIADSTPSTNIHAIIGRNGIGKTTLLNDMIRAIMDRENPQCSFLDTGLFWAEEPIAGDYFGSLVSVAFSAFDPFSPQQEQPDPAQGTCYFYLGLKTSGEGNVTNLKALEELHGSCVNDLKVCFSLESKKQRWINAIEALESDENFADMRFQDLAEYSGKALSEQILTRIGSLSSGHAIVLLTITKLVATVEEKTLVLIDEPESHLHPPLLSAFIRALSELLHEMNGVAIIATHSPVVLQEVPKSCVWKIERVGVEFGKSRPELETFGENVGVLTREAFGLAVTKSGFHKVLLDSVAQGGTYEVVMERYQGELGFEAQALLKALILNRDRRA